MTKPRAKLVLLSSSVMSGFGSMDIDYMAASAGLMEPVGSVLTYMLDRNTVQPSNIGVWAAREIVSSGVYGNMFKRLAADEDGDVSEGAGTAEVVCLSPEMSGSPEETKLYFEFCLSIRPISDLLYATGHQHVILDAYLQIIVPVIEGADAKTYYLVQFLAYAVFGLMNAWVLRGYKETPEEMVEIIRAWTTASEEQK